MRILHEAKIRNRDTSSERRAKHIVIKEEFFKERLFQGKRASIPVALGKKKGNS